MKKIINLFLIIILLISVLGCNRKNIYIDRNINLEEVKIEYGDIELAEFNKDNLVSSNDELTDYLDYMIYKSSLDKEYNEGFRVYFEPNYLNSIKDNFESNIKDSLQNGLLAHIFFNKYSYSLNTLDEVHYATFYLGYTNYGNLFNKEEDFNCSSFEYLNLLNRSGNNLSFQELPRFKKNKGFLEARNSEDLVYILEQGYFPYVKSDTKLFLLFQKIINILNKIVDLNQNEYDMYKNIYTYVINTNHYDYETLSNYSAQTRNNASFFLEGSVLNNVSVCDGLTKEIVVLSSLMNIEAYHIGAVNDSNGHAYLYVNILGTYYLSCPTSGILRYYKDGKFHDYYTMSYFLTKSNGPSNNFKYVSSYKKYILDNIMNIDAYDYYQNTIIKIDDLDLSLNVKKVDDARKIFRYVSNIRKNYNFDISIELNGDIDILNSAYKEFKDELNIISLSTGSFKGDRLNVYLFK